MTKAVMVAVTIWSLLVAGSASARDICAVDGLAPREDRMIFAACSGSLTPDMAVFCVNKLADELEEQRIRAERAIAQAECICNAMNKVIGAHGEYDKPRKKCVILR